jgi:hypothetical protein
MRERRLQATVIGPGQPGFLEVRFGSAGTEFIADAPSDGIPAALRMPNSTFVAVLSGRDFVRVEPLGGEWLQIQDRIRIVLNAAWDPIGVAEDVADEYDGYIGGIVSLLQRGASAEAIARHLGTIEVGWMSLKESPQERRLAIAEQLREIESPNLVRNPHDEGGGSE